MPPRVLCQRTAIDRHCYAGYERRLVRQQEHRHLGDFLEARRAAHRVASYRGFNQLLRIGVVVARLVSGRLTNTRSMGVSFAPGQIAFTRTPFLAYRLARPRAKLITPAFAANRLGSKTPTPVRAPKTCVD